MLKLQTEVATAVSNALKVTLLGDVAAKVELGGTRNPAAFDAYLRGSKAYNTRHSEQDLQAAMAAYTDAIGLDPSYALAFVGRSRSRLAYAEEFDTEAAYQGSLAKAHADSLRAIALAPELGQAHLALAQYLEDELDFAGASEELGRAVALAPGNAEVLAESGAFSVYMGRFDSGVAAARRAVVLDPLNPQSHYLLGRALYFSRRYAEALTAMTQAITLNPDSAAAYGYQGLTYYRLGDLNSARSSCEMKRDYWLGAQCLTMVYEKLGRHADAEAELTRMMGSWGDAEAYQYAGIYSEWTNRAKAFEWLDISMRLRDPGLIELKTDPLFDSLRREPRLQVIERELRFPD